MIIIVAVVTRYLAFGSRTMHGAVLQLHQDLEEAAQVGGVSWLKAIGYIVLPLLLPSIVAGWVFVALHALRETTMALMLYSPSSRVISLLMWDTWQSGDVNRAAATGVVLMVVTGLIILVGRIVDQRRATHGRLETLFMNPGRYSTLSHTHDQFGTWVEPSGDKPAGYFVYKRSHSPYERWMEEEGHPDRARHRRARHARRHPRRLEAAQRARRLPRTWTGSKASKACTSSRSRPAA